MAFQHLGDSAKLKFSIDQDEKCESKSMLVSSVSYRPKLELVVAVETVADPSIAHASIKCLANGRLIVQQMHQMKVVICS